MSECYRVPEFKYAINTRDPSESDEDELPTPSARHDSFHDASSAPQELQQPAPPPAPPEVLTSPYDDHVPVPPSSSALEEAQSEPPIEHVDDSCVQDSKDDSVASRRPVRQKSKPAWMDDQWEY